MQQIERYHKIHLTSLSSNSILLPASLFSAPYCRSTAASSLLAADVDTFPTTTSTLLSEPTLSLQSVALWRFEVLIFTFPVPF